MADPRNINHDKKVAKDRDDHDAAVQPQPGKKPPKVDSDTDPSNSRAKELYKDGERPRDHSHETPDGGDASKSK